MSAVKSLAPAGKPSALVDTRVIYCGDNLEQLEKLPAASVDLIYIDPPSLRTTRPRAQENRQLLLPQTITPRTLRIVSKN
ncbi:MAG: hypothetical protein ABIT76_01095 [Chthoniobacterales bacterium]